MNRRCLNCMQIFDAAEQEVNYSCPFCGFVENTPPKEPYHLYPGIVLRNRYIIGTVLGYGGFGIVYKAWDNALNSVVAVKEYYPAGSVQRVPGSKLVIVFQGAKKIEYNQGLSRFLDEARNMKKFQGNPHIVQVEDFFEENNTGYIVMEYLDGISLKGYLRQEQGKIDCDVAVDIILSITDALKDIHKENIIHRDISPDNIFLCQGNSVKLMDFGAARFSDEEKEITRSIILKPGFAPPEQYQSKSKQGPWTDIYALCATLYRMVTGVLPDESVNRVVEDEVKAPNELDSSIPEYLSNTIMRGMALNYELRFKSIEELEKALKKETKVLDVRLELKKRKKKRFIGVAIALALITAGGIYAFNIYRSKDVKLPETEITMWASYDEATETAEEKQAIYEDMIAYFLEEQSDVKVNIELIPESQYEQRLEDANGTDDMPTLYQSDSVSDEVLEHAVTLEGFYDAKQYKSLDANDCYYIFDKKYKNEITDSKKLPLGVNFPVAYVQVKSHLDIDSIDKEAFDDICSNNPKIYYVMPDYYEITSDTFEYSEDYFENDDKEYNMDSDSNAVELNTGLDDDSNEKLKLLYSGDLTYYFASIEELMTFFDVTREMGGDDSYLYDVIPLDADEIYGEFTDMWSIDSGAGKNEQKAACVLLRYMLDDSAQMELHVINKSAVPLNKNTLYDKDSDNSYIGVTGYSFLKEYIDKGNIISIQGEED